MLYYLLIGCFIFKKVVFLIIYWLIYYYEGDGIMVGVFFVLKNSGFVGLKCVKINIYFFD